MNVTIVKVGGGGNGSSGGNEFLGLDPTTELKPIPSPLSETSVTLPCDNNDTVTSGEWFYFFSRQKFNFLLFAKEKI